MATLDNLTNLIANAKSTPSGKIEWTDTSLKGIQQEVEYLFSQNAIQVVNNTTTLQSTINDNSQLVFVTSDPAPANNGIYFWNLTAVSTINFPAGSNGFWNLIQFGVTSSIAAGYIPYSNGSNFLPSYLRQTTNEIKMMGGSFVANNSTTTGPYFQAGDTDSIGNDIIFTIDDKNQVINSKKSTANKGIKLDFANNIHKIGDIDANKGLSVDTANTVYKLGNTSTNEGVVVNAANGYLGTATWGYVYNATTLIAGNSSINLTLNDTANTALLGDATKGLSVDVTNNEYKLGHISTGYGVFISSPFTVSIGDTANGNGLVIDNANETYTFANQTLGKGLFIDATAETYKLGTYAGYGLSLTASTGRLGSSTFGYNYTATTIIAGNSSVNLTLDDATNIATVGTTSLGFKVNVSSSTMNVGDSTKGLLVDVTNSLYKLGDLSTGTGLSLGATTGYLGSSTFGYNFTATTMIAGNASVNMTLNDTTNVATLGTTSIGLRADLTNNVVTAGTTAYGFKADITNGKIQLNGTGTYGFEMWDTIKSVYTYGATGVEGLYVDLLGHNYSLGGNNVALNISNTGKTLQTILNPSGIGTNVNGLNFDYTADTYLLGGEYGTKSAAIGVYASRTATPQIQLGSDFAVVATATGTQTHKVRVYIPGVGVRYIPVYQ